jgi:hypothetical protein
LLLPEVKDLRREVAQLKKRIEALSWGTSSTLKV